MKKTITYTYYPGSAFAQQDYQITHYMFDNLSFNRLCGMNKNINATMIADNNDGFR